MITKDKNEDIILLDNYFDIQGISSRLMYKLNIDNKELFSKFNIPFYAICKQFVGLYKNMSVKKKKKLQIQIIIAKDIGLNQNIINL